MLQHIIMCLESFGLLFYILLLSCNYIDTSTFAYLGFFSRTVRIGCVVMFKGHSRFDLDGHLDIDMNMFFVRLPLNTWRMILIEFNRLLLPFFSSFFYQINHNEQTHCNTIFTDIRLSSNGDRCFFIYFLHMTFKVTTIPQC